MFNLVLTEEELKENNNGIKNLFSNSPISEIGSCDTTDHIAIYPARLALSSITEQSKSSIFKRQVKHTFESIKNREYICRRLKDGWLYAFHVDTKQVYEYKIIDDIFTSTRIYNESESKWKENEGKGRFYIRCPNTINTLRLFYSPVQCSDKWLQDKLASKVYYLWQKEINLKLYRQKGFPYEAPNSSLYTSLNSLINDLKLDVKTFSHTYVTPDIIGSTKLLNSQAIQKRNNYVSKLQKIKSKFTASDTSIKTIDNYIISLQKIVFGDGADYSKEIDTDKLLNGTNKERNRELSKSKMLIQEKRNSYIKTDSNRQERMKHEYFASYVPISTLDDLLQTLKISLEKLLYDHVIYTDRTAPIRYISKFIADLNGKNKFSDTTTIINDTPQTNLQLFQTVKKTKTAQSILNAIDDDNSVKCNPLNMLVVIDDITAVTQDLLLSLDAPSNDTLIFNTNNYYANTIASQCFSVLTQTPFSTYSSSLKDIAERAVGNNKKNIEQINLKELNTHLLHWQSLEKKSDSAEYNLKNWLDILNKQIEDKKLNFCTQHGFDNSDQEQLTIITEIYLHVFTILCRSTKGKTWISQQMQQKAPISFILTGFDESLYKATEDYAKQYTIINTQNNSFFKDEDIISSSNTITTITSSLNIDNFVSSNFYKNLSEASKNIFLNIFKTNDDILKKLVATTGFSISASITNIKSYLKLDYQILSYAILSSFAAEAQINLIDATKNYNTWKEKCILLSREALEAAKAVDIDRVNKNRGFDADQKLDNYNQKHKQLTKAQQELEKFYTIEKFSSTDFSSIEPPEQTKVKSYNPKAATSKLDISSSIIIIDGLLNIWNTIKVYNKYTENKTSLTSTEGEALLQSNIALFNSSLNIWMEKLTKLDLPYFEKIGSTNKISILNENINRLSQIIGIIGVVQGIFDLTNSIKSLKKSSNSVEAGFLAANVGLSCVSICLCIAQAAATTSNPIGEAVAAIMVITAALSYIFAMAARYFHKTDLQLWLRYCYWGINPRWKNQPQTISKNINDELYALDYLLSTPVLSGQVLDTEEVTSTASVSLSPVGVHPTTKYYIREMEIYINFSSNCMGKSAYVTVFTDNFKKLSYTWSTDGLKLTVPIKDTNFINPNTSFQIKTAIHLYSPSGKNLSYLMSFISTPNSQNIKGYVEGEVLDVEDNLFKGTYDTIEIIKDNLVKEAFSTNIHTILEK